ncbi:single-stranded DNA-binding protein [Mucilaginibacter pedocola]|uniref:Single-stranded DNA-binding protein n=1 Tax=Mucilaginibacter pedocola TaxID=1792845 RepID=A0A1S9PFG4_9SPHI|nr:single-stranded DNA-binding protein [Mucilaginibacter pedocola]OOQ59338.1 hypothetical protein BC343_27975 [Mucilaginibacter pedocola]
MLNNIGVNRVILLGTLGEGISECTDTEGNAFLCISLHTSEQVKKESKQPPHHEYHKVKVPQKLLAQDGLKLRAGQTLYVEGKIHTTSFVDEQRVRRYNLEVIAGRIEVVGAAMADI